MNCKKDFEKYVMFSGYQRIGVGGIIIPSYSLTTPWADVYRQQGSRIFSTQAGDDSARGSKSIWISVRYGAVLHGLSGLRGDRV